MIVVGFPAIVQGPKGPEAQLEIRVSRLRASIHR